MAKKAVSLLPVPGADDPTPGKFAFTARLDELFAQGWPHLFVLSDEAVTPAQSKREALKACQAVDPYLPTLVPRDTAERMLSGYLHNPYEAKGSIQAALAKPEPVTPALLERVLEAKFRRLPGETYVYRLREVLFLFEAFLGTETVVEAMVEHLSVGLEPENWGKTAFDQDHENANFRRSLLAFGWLRLRFPVDRWNKLTKPLLKGHPKLPKFTQSLRVICDDTAPLPPQLDWYSADAACQRRDPAPLRMQLERWPKNWDEPQWVYALGSDFLREANVTGLRLSPKWQQQRHLAELGAIRAPGTLRIIEALLTSRSVSAEAVLWLEQHRDWVEHEGLPVLDGWSHTKAVAENIRRVMRGEALPSPPKPAELRKQLKQLFKDLPAQMKACKGDPEAERAAMRTAFESYCEINAALGEISPDAYFTHQLGLKWRAPEADIQRWIDIAVDVASP
ncbi:MAG: hypothetical protein R3B07_29455 [Polyangiaceae bacterium]